MHINCPRCQNPIEIVVDDKAEEIVCPSCGSNIQLDPGRTKTFLPDQAPRRLGKFEFLEVLGLGGYGTVYKARDTELDRTVAIKIPRAGNLATQEDVDRFLREARAAAQLKHPSIVSVHDAGQSDGTCFLVSELVHGSTLADRLASKRLSFREAAELMAQVAEALDYAHRQGVIHRDLKPSNIMLDLEGKPHVMDFVLAKREAGEITVTLDGQVLGTPAYMSPEQARGEGHDVDARSDVYSLGVVLYELVTGELPFRGNKRMLIVQVLQDEPSPPCRINDRIPRDLETITLKCMAKEPSRRYGSAGELADDLRRYLNGEPIHARPVGPVERAWRWAKRNPRVTGLSAAVLLLLVTVAAGASVAAVVINHHRILADQASTQAEQNAAVAREQSQLALKSLESVIFDIQRKLDSVPGAGDLQRSLLQTAVARLREVSDQFASRSAIDRNTKVALDDLGDMFLRIRSASPRPGPPGRGAWGEGADESDGPLAAARKVYQQAFDIAQKLAAADPSDAQAQRDLIISHAQLGTVYRALKNYTQSVMSFEMALKIASRLRVKGKLAGDIERLIQALESDRKQSEHAAMALGDWKTLLEQPAELLPVLLELRGTQLVQEGRTAEAVQAVAKLRELGTATADQLYNAACVYSLCAAGVQASGRREPAETSKGPRPPLALTADESAARQQHIADALATLREAIAAGWNDFAHTQKDPELTVLRDLPEFKARLPKP